MSTPKIAATFRKRTDHGTQVYPQRLDGPKHAVWDDLNHESAASKTQTRATWAASYAWKLRVTDSLVIAFVLSSAYLLWFGVGLEVALGPAQFLNFLLTGIVLLVIWTLDLEFSRTREMRVFGAGAVEYRRVLQSTLRAFGALAIVMAVLHMDISRGFFALAFPLGAVLLLSSRWTWRRWLARQRRAGNCLTNVVILGNSEDVGYVIGQLRDNLAAGYKVVGVALTTLDEKLELKPPWYKIHVMSTLADIGRVVGVTGAQAVIVAGPLPGGPTAIRELGWRLEDLSTELVLASNLTNVAGPRIHFRPVEGLPLMHVELPQYSGGKHLVKRTMDVFLSVVALLILLPVLLVLTVIVRLDSHGPALFFQDRVGRNGNAFKMVKFRSMVIDAEEKLAVLAEQNQGNGVLFKIPNDPRITRCGRWMRKYSLDELPQLWNVLIGEMSMVGPRPPLKTEVDNYEKPAHRRLLIKPGITGLWQVSGRSDLEWGEAVRLDLYYVENWSLTGDIIILWRTFKAVYQSTGAY